MKFWELIFRRVIISLLFYKSYILSSVCSPKFSQVSTEKSLRTSDKNRGSEKGEKVGTDTRCRARLFAFPTTRNWRRTWRTCAIVEARKRALASLCIFQETRVRRAAVKWQETDRISLRQGSYVIACFLSPSFVPSRNADSPINMVVLSPFPSWPLPPLLYLARFITFAISRREARLKVANAGITQRKPQLRRFKRLTAMRAISDRGRLSTGRSKR